MFQSDGHSQHERVSENGFRGTQFEYDCFYPFVVFGWGIGIIKGCGGEGVPKCTTICWRESEKQSSNTINRIEEHTQNTNNNYFTNRFRFRNTDKLDLHNSSESMQFKARCVCLVFKRVIDARKWGFL